MLTKQILLGDWYIYCILAILRSDAEAMKGDNDAPSCTPLQWCDGMPGIRDANTVVTRRQEKPELSVDVETPVQSACSLAANNSASVIGVTFVCWKSLFRGLTHKPLLWNKQPIIFIWCCFALDGWCCFNVTCYCLRLAHIRFYLSTTTTTGSQQLYHSKRLARVLQFKLVLSD